MHHGYRYHYHSYHPQNHFIVTTLIININIIVIFIASIIIIFLLHVIKFMYCLRHDTISEEKKGGVLTRSLSR